MTGLRIVVLVLALCVFAAVGWRLAEQRPVRVAATPLAPTVQAPVVPTPIVPTPVAPKVPAPAPVVAPSSPPTTPAPAAPMAPTAPVDPSKPASGKVVEDGRAAVLAVMAGASDLSRAFALLQAEFPAVAERAVTTAEVATGKGASPTADDILADAMRDLRLSSGVLAARAGPEALGSLFDAKAATLADLEAADPRMCADYVFGGSSPEFNAFALSHRGLVARQDLATIAAMADGRVKRISWEAPSTDDFAALESALKGKGLSAAEVAAVLDGKNPDPPLPDARVCANARAYLDAMRSLPTDSRNRVYGLAADLLARS